MKPEWSPVQYLRLILPPMDLPCQSVAVSLLRDLSAAAQGQGAGWTTMRPWGRRCGRERIAWEGAGYKQQPCGRYTTKAICCHTPITECNLNLVGVDVTAKYLHGFYWQSTFENVFCSALKSKGFKINCITEINLALLSIMINLAL